jgi:hypothetical protein
MKCCPSSRNVRRKLEDYARRHGQDPITAVDDVPVPGSKGKARISTKPLMASAGDMKT